MLSPITTVPFLTLLCSYNHIKSLRYKYLIWSMKIRSKGPCCWMKFSYVCRVPIWMCICFDNPQCYCILEAISATCLSGYIVWTIPFEAWAIIIAEYPTYPPSSKIVFGWYFLMASFTITDFSSPIFIIQCYLQ